MLSRLQKTYATSTPALAVDKAIQSEDAVYSLLRRISQLEEELKSANQQNEELQKQVDASATGTYDESHEGEKGSHQLIKSMEDRTTEAEASKQRAINKYEQLSKVYIEVKAGVIALCEKVGVDMEEDAVATADTSITTSILDRNILFPLSPSHISPFPHFTFSHGDDVSLNG
jgi:seryl-tRNA synthetase